MYFFAVTRTPEVSRGSRRFDGACRRGNDDAGGVPDGSRWSERSERPPVHVRVRKSTPEESRIKYKLRDTPPRPLPRSEKWGRRVPVVARFARTTGYHTGRLRRHGNFPKLLSIRGPTTPGGGLDCSPARASSFLPHLVAPSA